MYEPIVNGNAESIVLVAVVQGHQTAGALTEVSTF
jgi:hypothetical protein